MHELFMARSVSVFSNEFDDERQPQITEHAVA